MDKVYALPNFEYIEYNGYCLAIAPDKVYLTAVVQEEIRVLSKLFTTYFLAPMITLMVYTHLLLKL